jgi:hypothetical protein
MPTPVVAAPVKRRSTANRLVDGLLVVSLVAAAGGVGYAVGRQTAPASSTTGGPNRNGFAGFGGTTGTTGNGTRGNGTTGTGTAQVPSPSGAPAIPDGTTAPGTGEQPSASQAPQGGGNLPQGGPGGFGRGGLGGTVAAVDPTSITVSTADGQQLQVTTTDTTTYHQQVPATADAATVGVPVRVTVAGGFGGRGGFGGPQASPAASVAPVAATEVELLAEAPAATTGGRGGRGGAVTGTVSAIDGSLITVTTADGQTTQVTTDDTTIWVQQTVITRDKIATGASVRFTVEGRGGFGGGQGQGQGQPQGDPTASISVSDVEVLLAAS